VRRAHGIEDLLREAAPQVLGAVVRRFGDFAGSEDAVQEAMLAAATGWPAQGTPQNPTGWLIHVASRRMIDQLRSEQARRKREGLAVAREIPAANVGAEAGVDVGVGIGGDIGGVGGDASGVSDDIDRVSGDASGVSGDASGVIGDASGVSGDAGIGSGGDVGDHDDTLALMFMCTHPALTAASAIALTLRAVGGLTTAEIAAAFLVPEATMAQRISRAKQRIKSSGIPFGMPDAGERAGRLRSVSHVLYLIFNEGYLASVGRELARKARGPARMDADGALVPLTAQDRTLWRQDLIAEGVALVAAAFGRGSIGEYQVQAAIAAVHDQAATTQDTDWREILGLYGVLERMTNNPMVALNRAVAVAMIDGPAAGLELLEALEKPLAGHHRLPAVRAHLLEMAGHREAAIADYRTAASQTASLPEQHYLLTQAARLGQRNRRPG
jgi:predicted RNA polymerase sigma factor